MEKDVWIIKKEMGKRKGRRKKETVEEGKELERKVVSRIEGNEREVEGRGERSTDVTN